MGPRIPLSYDDYTVGWIYVLPVETTAAKLILDKIHTPLPRLPMDQNTNILGSIGKHNVVITSLPSGAYGSTSATTIVQVQTDSSNKGNMAFLDHIITELSISANCCF